MQVASANSRRRRRLAGPQLGLALCVLANTQCLTASRAPVGSPAASAWLADHEGRAATIKFRPPWSSSLSGRLERTSPILPTMVLPPTQIRLAGSSDERAIPLEWVRDVKVVERARGTGEGAMVGAAAGLAVGVIFAMVATNYGGTIGCSEGRNCHGQDLPAATGAGLLYGLVLTAPIGAALGALVGGGIGHRNVLTFD
jgi:hypothetical protein